MNKITFYAYKLGTRLPSGKSPLRHVFIELYNGTIFGWIPENGGGICLRKDIGLEQLEDTISASFYIGDITVIEIQNMINTWQNHEKGYWPFMQDCVYFVKSIICVINRNFIQGLGDPIPDTGSKFPKSVVESLIITSNRIGDVQISC